LNVAKSPYLRDHPLIVYEWLLQLHKSTNVSIT
jgi:hypothetical protein